MSERYYSLTSEEVVNLINANNDGLTEIEANRRLLENGPNKLKDVTKKSILQKFVEQFKNVMIILLLFAAGLSAFVSINEGESLMDSFIIVFVVVLNAILGVVQENKAEKTVESLKKMTLPYIKVRRAGKVVSLKTEDLVIGDIVLIEAGDYAPADMRVLLCHSLRVDEAALTGESVPVDKTINRIDSQKDVPLADRNNMIYSGCSIVYGRGEAVVVATGMNTELGKIAQEISTNKIELTPLQVKINKLSKVLTILVVIIALTMFAIGCYEKNPIIDSFMTSISLAVAAIPEGLVAVITIILAIGVQKMSKKNAIVRKLSAVETLGSTSIICSDKTGTLTQNKMTVRKIFINNTIVDLADEYSLSNLVEENDIDEKDVDLFSKIYILCNDTKFTENNGYKALTGDPTETALVSFGEKLGYSKEEMEDKYVRISEIPFDSVRKMMTTINEVDKGGYLALTKGAVESVLDASACINIGGKVLKLTEEMKKDILEKNLFMANSALRVLAFAYKNIAEVPEDLIQSDIESELVFVGLIGMIDPPRPEAKAAIEECYKAGITPIMITGDNLNTAIAIAKELNIISDDRQAMTGSQIDELSNIELEDIIEKINVYARVSPENKIRIVKAWQSKNKIVAMTGDGVNDAPALKAADIGVGMGITGTEVSKSVSSIVLSDDNFSTIVSAVKEGRRIYNNIKNVIVYLLSSNLAEVLIVFIATILNQHMLLPIQLLWINLVTDTIPAVGLGFEKADKDIMNYKPNKKDDDIFSSSLTSKIVIFAVIKSITVFLVYFIVKNYYGPNIATGAAFISLANIEIFFSYVCRSVRKSIKEIGFFTNKILILSLVGTFLLQFSVVAVDQIGALLKVSSIPMHLYWTITLLSFITALLLEFVKLLLVKIFKEDKY